MTCFSQILLICTCLYLQVTNVQADPSEAENDNRLLFLPSIARDNTRRDAPTLGRDVSAIGVLQYQTGDAPGTESGVLQYQTGDTPGTESGVLQYQTGDTPGTESNIGLRMTSNGWQGNKLKADVKHDDPEQHPLHQGTKDDQHGDRLEEDKSCKHKHGDLLVTHLHPRTLISSLEGDMKSDLADKNRLEAPVHFQLNHRLTKRRIQRQAWRADAPQNSISKLLQQTRDAALQEIKISEKTRLHSGGEPNLTKEPAITLDQSSHPADSVVAENSQPREMNTDFINVTWQGGKDKNKTGDLNMSVPLPLLGIQSSYSGLLTSTNHTDMVDDSAAKVRKMSPNNIKNSYEMLDFVHLISTPHPTNHHTAGQTSKDDTHATENGLRRMTPTQQYATNGVGHGTIKTSQTHKDDLINSIEHEAVKPNQTYIDDTTAENTTVKTSQAHKTDIKTMDSETLTSQMHKDETNNLQQGTRQKNKHDVYTTGNKIEGTLSPQEVTNLLLRVFRTFDTPEPDNNDKRPSDVEDPLSHIRDLLLKMINYDTGPKESPVPHKGHDNERYGYTDKQLRFLPPFHLKDNHANTPNDSPLSTVPNNNEDFNFQLRVVVEDEMPTEQMTKEDSNLASILRQTHLMPEARLVPVFGTNYDRAGPIRFPFPFPPLPREQLTKQLWHNNRQPKWLTPFRLEDDNAELLTTSHDGVSVKSRQQTTMKNSRPQSHIFPDFEQVSFNSDRYEDFPGSDEITLIPQEFNLISNLHSPHSNQISYRELDTGVSFDQPKLTIARPSGEATKPDQNVTEEANGKGKLPHNSGIRGNMKAFNSNMARLVNLLEENIPPKQHLNFRPDFPYSKDTLFMGTQPEINKIISTNTRPDSSKALPETVTSSHEEQSQEDIARYQLIQGLSDTEKNNPIQSTLIKFADNVNAIPGLNPLDLDSGLGVVKLDPKDASSKKNNNDDNPVSLDNTVSPSENKRFQQVIYHNEKQHDALNNLATAINKLQKQELLQPADKMHSSNGKTKPHSGKITMNEMQEGVENDDTDPGNHYSQLKDKQRQPFAVVMGKMQKDWEIDGNTASNEQSFLQTEKQGPSFAGMGNGQPVSGLKEQYQTYSNMNEGTVVPLQTEQTIRLDTHLAGTTRNTGSEGQSVKKDLGHPETSPPKRTDRSDSGDVLVWGRKDRPIRAISPHHGHGHGHVGHG